MSIETRSDAHSKHAVSAALQQLFSALVAEGLIQGPADGTPAQGSWFASRVYRLGRAGWQLQVSRTLANCGLFQQFDTLTAVSSAGERRRVEHPRDLLTILDEAGVFNVDALVRLGIEISESICNDAACRRFRTRRDNRIDRTLRRREGSFWNWVSAGACGRNHELFLEQWSAVGHPYHVTKKSKQALVPDEVQSLSPEFAARVPLTLIAVRRERIRVETAAGSEDYSDYIASQFPDWLEKWRSKLDEAHLSASDFVPVPAHPVQVRDFLPRLMVGSARNDIVVPKNVELSARPTSSFRTLVPLASPSLPHLKVAVGLRLTTVPRTISPRSCELGPRIGVLLREIASKDSGVADNLAVVPETHGVHFVASGAAERELESNIAAIVRQNPMQLVGMGEWLVPSTAFSVPVPGSGAPFFVDILRASGNDSLAEVQGFFRRYSRKLLYGLLKLYLGYGIALEAHQQNMFAVLNDDGDLLRFIARDFGGMRIHRPTLEDRGYSLELHPDRLTIREDWSAVQRKLITPVFHYHLGEIAATLGNCFGCSDRPFWRDLTEVSAAVFDDIHGQVDSALWAREREAILTREWEIKATLRMRLADATSDLYTPFPNPMSSPADFTKHPI